MDLDQSSIFWLLGILIITVSLMLHFRKRSTQQTKKNAEKRVAMQEAQEAEIKRRREAGLSEQARPGTKSGITSQARVPLKEPFQNTFTSSVIPSQIAKWETEIHQIGRQTIGQIDSKMVALQTILLEANRAANRLEILLERLNEISKPTQTIPRERDVASEPTAKPFVPQELREIPESAPESVQKNHEGEVERATVLKLGTTEEPSDRRPAPFSSNSAQNAPRDIKAALSDVERAKLDHRQQVEMLDDYGYSPNDIAQNLNITVGEVELILSLRAAPGRRSR